MDIKKKSLTQNNPAHILFFESFSNLQVGAIAVLLTGSRYFPIRPTSDDEEKKMNQCRALCLYANPAIRNRFFKVNKTLYSFFSWENIHPWMCDRNLRAHDNDIQSLFMRILTQKDTKMIDEFSNHYALNYGFIKKTMLIGGIQECVNANNTMHPLVKACVMRCSQKVREYLMGDAKNQDINRSNRFEILDASLWRIVENNDENSLELILADQYIHNQIMLLPPNFINSFAQLAQQLGYSKIGKTLSIMQAGTFQANPTKKKSKKHAIIHFSFF
jgi:hypothetical protein